MNKVILIGRLCKDSEVRVSQGEKAMTILRNSLAVGRKGKDAGTDFINIVAFGNTADFIDKYFSKGSRIAITGHIQTGSYKNKDGNTVYTTDVIIDDAEFVDSKSTETKAETQTENAGNNFMFIPENIAEELPFT